MSEETRERSFDEIRKAAGSSTLPLYQGRVRHDGITILLSRRCSWTEILEWVALRQGVGGRGECIEVRRADAAWPHGEDASA